MTAIVVGGGIAGAVTALALNRAGLPVTVYEAHPNAPDDTGGLLSLAATARRGLRPDQIAEHCQRLVGGLDVLVGLTNAEQAQAMTWLWGPLGRAFAGLDPVDVIVDCGRLGAGSPLTDLLREADFVVLLTRATLDDGDTSVSLTNSQPVQYVLLWITRLGGSGSDNSTEIRELSFRRVAD